MAKGFKRGAGGGTNLNFKLIGNPQPENPKENTIWVNTDVKITGWYFNPIQPDAPQEGMVWIIISTSSTAEFNALKKNGIQIYPMAVKQYISGEFVNKPAKIMKNGAWLDIAGEVYLYNSGDECTALTGGWASFGSSYNDSQYKVAPTVSRGSDKIVFSLGEVNAGGGIARTKEKIDVTNFTKLKFTGSMQGYSAAYVQMCLWNVNPDPWATNAAASVSSPVSSEVFLDISKLTGEYWVGFGLYHFNANVTMKSLKLLY